MNLEQIRKGIQIPQGADPAEINALADDFFSVFLQENCRKHVISDSVQENDFSAFYVVVTAMNLDMNTAEDPQHSVDLVKQWAADHSEEVNRIRSEKGSDALQAYLSSLQCRYYFDELKAAAKAAPDRELSLMVTARKEKDSWEITRIDLADDCRN